MYSNAVAKSEINILPADWFDGDDFIAEPHLWGREVAERIARVDGIPQLSTKHGEVIVYVRGKRYLNGSLPVMRLVCRACSINRHKADKLFGSCKSLWRVAGLPHPGAEANAFMS